MFKGFKISFGRKGNRTKPSQEDLAELFRFKYSSFKELLGSNAENLNIIADIEEKLQGHQVFGMAYVRSQAARSVFHTLRMIKSLNALSGRRYPTLYQVLEEINSRIKKELGRRKEVPVEEWVLPYSRINKEMVDWVGGKSANLGEVHNSVGLPIPRGFAITTAAYEAFLVHNDLVDEINKRKMELDPQRLDSIAAVSEEIQRLIISSPLPPGLEEAIHEAYMAIPKGRAIAMRSSAIGEDSDLSFAGQYLSFLNVPRDKVIQTYKFIVASLYTPRAMSYRLNKGIRDEDTAMSVACLEMLESVASGVMYSRHPFDPLQDSVIVTAVWGLGPYAVDGKITPDTYSVARDGIRILDQRISHKPVQLMANPEGGLLELSVPDHQQDEPCLAPDQVRQLAGYALALERHFGCPQDIEWALDRDGRLFVLQSRPLRFMAEKAAKGALTVRAAETDVLIEGGAVACPGVGSGPAFHVRSEDDLMDFPEGAVLVARDASPKYVVVMNKAHAIVADSGSVTGHMASLAREFGVPSILDAKVATAKIPHGAEITVDAYTGRVYRGRVPGLLALQISRKPHMEGTPVYDTLKRVSRWIIPLHLVDPKSPNFAPRSCASLHDIMRYVHEMSYSEMFQISDIVSTRGGGALRLEGPIPLDLHVIDLGDGLTGVPERARRAKVEQIASIPFRALLKGMLHGELRSTEPRPIHLKGFLSVMSEQMLTNPHASERFGERTYAIISDKYMNFSSRVGYHYGVVDAYCGATSNKNYITFSFKGGAADDVRRNRRARAIGKILEALGFTVEVKGDRVDARFQRYDQPTTEEKLELLGRLLQFTRQMDMLMASEASVSKVTECFL
ncbi:MAG: PEP/pyruvate-binding domain-containing protein, partial [Thermodesulfobacteriota bacterium]